MWCKFKEINFYYPSKTLPISLTGKECEFSCKHCNSHYLKGMVEKDKIDSILKSKEIKSCLISGGYNKSGEVPLMENLLFLKELKKNGLKLNLHTGLISIDTTLALKKIEPIVSFDFLIDEETIKEVYSLNNSKFCSKFFVETFENFLNHKIKVIPHIIIGIYKGKIKGEFSALEYLASKKIKEVVFLIFTPTPKTAYEKLSPPDLDEIEKVFSFGRKILPSADFSLGCMRPVGSYREKLDLLAIKYGFNKIVMPSAKIRDYVKKQGIKVNSLWECCVFN